MTTLLAQFSNVITAQVAAAAPLLAAIRTGPNRHVSGIIWRSDLVLTSDQSLPVRDQHTIVLPGGRLCAAQEVGRDSASNLALLELDCAAASVAIRAPLEPAVGGLVLVLGADAAASPGVRAGLVHRIAPGPAGSPGLERVLTLDLPFRLQEEGGPVLDATGALLGMAACGAEGEALVTPYASLARLVAELAEQRVARQPTLVPSPADEPAPEGPVQEQADVSRADPELPFHPSVPRGWLGVALRPVAVPDTLRVAAGCRAGRMVLSLSPNGPAYQAGLEHGDLLLSLDGITIGGPNVLRRLLGPEMVGREVSVRLARGGKVLTVALRVQAQPPA